MKLDDLQIHGVKVSLPYAVSDTFRYATLTWRSVPRLGIIALFCVLMFVCLVVQILLLPLYAGMIGIRAILMRSRFFCSKVTVYTTAYLLYAVVFPSCIVESVFNYISD